MRGVLICPRRGEDQLIDAEVRDARRHTLRAASKRDGSDARSQPQKDRDRVLYTSSFRRLAQVTQVVAADTGHVFHNRLTHSLQVAQVGCRLPERLIKQHGDEIPQSTGLDPDVVEAACLAHDLGHPPFGHIAEEELNELAGPSIDGFEGNAQSFRIVTKLSQHSPLHRGLDLTRATLAAVLKYPWLKDRNPQKPGKWGAYRSEEKDFRFALELGGGKQERTIEAQLMDWADDISYSVHDLDDFFRARRIPLHLLANRRYDHERAVFFEAAEQRHAGESGIWADHSALREAFNQVMIGLFPLQDVYSGAWEERAALREFTSQLIGRYIGGSSLKVGQTGTVEVHVDEHLQMEVAMLKELTWIYIIEAPSLISQQYGQRHVIQRLFEIYKKAASGSTHRNLFPPYYREALEESSDDNSKRRIVIDLIAGMTEEQALAIHNRLTGVSLGSGLEELLL
jgi:dGTPase